MKKRGEDDHLKYAVCESTLSTAARSPFPNGEGLRYENAAFPILSFRAKARNLFRSRSGKGCEDSGEREAPCSQRIGRTVFHADSITKENGNGKRKRSLGCARDDETRKRLFPFLFNLLRKPTPPRCARQPLPREGARVDTPLLPMEGGAPKGRRLDGESGMKKIEGDRLKCAIIREHRYPHIVRANIRICGKKQYRRTKPSPRGEGGERIEPDRVLAV